MKTSTPVCSLLKSTDALRNLEVPLVFYSGSWALRSVNSVKNAIYARAANLREQTGREGPLVLVVLGSGKLGFALYVAADGVKTICIEGSTAGGSDAAKIILDAGENNLAKPENIVADIGHIEDLRKQDLLGVTPHGQMIPQVKTSVWCDGALAEIETGKDDGSPRMVVSTACTAGEVEQATKLPIQY